MNNVCSWFIRAKQVWLLIAPRFKTTFNQAEFVEWCRSHYGDVSFVYHQRLQLFRLDDNGDQWQEGFPGPIRIGVIITILPRRFEITPELTAAGLRNAVQVYLGGSALVTSCVMNCGRDYRPVVCRIELTLTEPEMH